jgi:hypothetical protein
MLPEFSSYFRIGLFANAFIALGLLSFLLFTPLVYILSPNSYKRYFYVITVLILLRLRLELPSVVCTTTEVSYYFTYFVLSRIHVVLPSVLVLGTVITISCLHYN